MSKYVKNLLQSEFEKVLADRSVREFVVMSLTGVNGVDNNLMRGGLRKKGMDVLVVKNALFRRALLSRKMDTATALFDGPCAVAYGGDSVVDVARELTDWGRKIKAMRFRGAYVDGTVLAGSDIEMLAKMPTRRELLGQVAGCILSPGARVASAVGASGSKIASCVKTVIEKAEKAEKADKQAA
jgi:large subunit ribosomal protein L10